MSQGLASGSLKNYGSTNNSSRIPEVSFSGSGNQFSPTELYDVSDQITSSIQEVSECVKKLENNFKNFGTSKDSLSFRNEVQKIIAKGDSIIINTTKAIHRLAIIVKRGDKKQKLRVDKLTANFKEVLQLFEKVQKKVTEKSKTCIISVEFQFYDGEGETQPEDEQQKLIAKQEKINRDLEFEKGLLIEREQRVKEVESSVLDFNQIMKELNTLVHLQSDSINTIEDNIEIAHSEVEAGHRELQKAETYQDKSRRKTCFLLGVAIVIGFILTLSIVLSIKK